MNSLLITGGPCQRSQEFELSAEAYSISLFDGRIVVMEGVTPGDILLLRGGDGYIFCGSAAPDAILNREPATQRRLASGDELRVGPFRLQFHTDAPFPREGPRARGNDWLRAFLCSIGLIVLLLAVGFLLRGSTGGSGDSGEGSGIADSGEGEGNGSDSGEGDGEGPGKGTGEAGTGTGAGFAGEGSGAASTTEPTGTSAAETGTATEEPPTEAETAPAPASPPGAAPAVPAPPESPPTPPPGLQKFAIVTPGAAVQPAPAAPPAGLIGERGGGGQILGTGDVQITLRWDTAPDVDLHVTDPNGEEIWFQHVVSRSGGRLDVDDTSFEGPENVFWPTGGAPHGRFVVEVELFSGNSANWWVRTRIDGVEKVYRGSLTGQGSRKRVIEFNR